VLSLVDEGRIMQGYFIGIGVGPGDPDLLTLKAIKALNSIDVLMSPKSKNGTPSLALSIVKSHLPQALDIRERLFPMVVERDVLHKAWEDVCIEIEQLVNEGKRVGFITLGDAMTYSTYSYLLKGLKGRVQIHTIPGITSYQSVASRVSTPLVEGDHPLVIVPCTMGFEKVKELIVAYPSLVLMKITSCFEELINFIIKEELEAYTYLVSLATQEGEQVITDLSTLRVKDANTQKMSYFSTIVINKGWSKDEY
jgi:precorrin-2/cobalt-factor-2 C20-methyltransferase